ncbi:MAG: DUF92 domain-containing protein [Clostridia bacterium]|nr:DUF92 domain-containing protein [Clostridia bacterium]
MGYLAEIGYIAAVCLLSAALHRWARLPSSVTRKLTHILIGFVFVIQYHFFRDDPLGLLLVPTIVTVSLFLVARFRLVRSMVNPENPYGIFYYALAILLSNAVSILYPPYHAAAGAAILALSLGDGAAALITPLFRRRHRLIGKKTAEGSLLCFLFSLLGMWLIGVIFPAIALPLPLLPLLAMLATLLELFGGRFDNPAIVFGVGLVAALAADLPTPLLLRLSVGALAGAAVVLLSVRGRMLTLPAALLSYAFLLIILAFGGYAAALYILLLYAVAGALSALGRHRRNRHADGVRGVRQVVANAAVGTAALLLFGIFGKDGLHVAYYAAIAEFVADTAASDVGTLVPRDPIDICRLRRIPRGRSGGVTLLGTAAALAACLLALPISLLALSLRGAVIAAAAAFLGVLFDSVTGSLLQAKYRCRLCGDYTERPRHCDTPAERIGGLRLLDNSRVNLVSTLFSAVLALVLTAVL